MMGIHIISDGNNAAFRANSVTELYTKGGVRTSAIMGTLNITHSVMQELERLYKLPIKEHIYAFDGGHSARRKELYPEYKANRKHDRSEDEEVRRREFLDQANSLYENLPLFGVKTIRIHGWEGDDIIYGLTQVLLQEYPDDMVVVVSTDEDFHQLVAMGIDVYNPIRKVLYTKGTYAELFGIQPESFITYKILKGDSSDGINGISGIGDKTAKNLVNKYGDIDGILDPANRDTLMKSKRTARIFTPEGLSILDRNNKLINLLDYVDITGIIDELVDTVDEHPIVESKLAREYLMEYQLTSILVKWKDWIEAFDECVSNFSK